MKTITLFYERTLRKLKRQILMFKEGNLNVLYQEENS